MPNYQYNPARFIVTLDGFPIGEWEDESEIGLEPLKELTQFKESMDGRSATHSLNPQRGHTLTMQIAGNSATMEYIARKIDTAKRLGIAPGGKVVVRNMSSGWQKWTADFMSIMNHLSFKWSRQPGPVELKLQGQLDFNPPPA